jgi:hypothetical protein
MRRQAVILLALALGSAIEPAPAGAAFGSPVLARGRVLLGVTTRQFKRDIYDVEAAAISNPNDTFGYVALESRLGLWRDRLDFGLEAGRSHNKQDRFTGRDYLTWELGVTLRGRLYTAPDGRADFTAGVHFRDTVAFDRAPTLTHKLQRNYAAFALAGRRAAVRGRPLRIYGGPLYSRHVIDEYGVSYQVGEGPAKGETRSNLEFLGGASARVLDAVEVTGELEFRDSVSFGLSAGVLF